MLPAQEGDGVGSLQVSLATGGALSLVSGSPFGYPQGDLWLQLSILGRSREVSTMAVQLTTGQALQGAGLDAAAGGAAGWSAGDPRLNPYLLLSSLSAVQPTGAMRRMKLPFSVPSGSPCFI